MNLDSALNIGTGLTLSLLSFGMLKGGCPRNSGCDSDNSRVGTCATLNTKLGLCTAFGTGLIYVYRGIRL